MGEHRYGNVTIPTEPAPGLPDYLVLAGGASWDDNRWSRSCDYEGCFEPDYIDIIEGTSDELRAVYLDTRHDVMICRKCVDAGKHMED